MSFNVDPQKMEIANLVSGESRSFMYNPSQLSESITANYAELTIPGLSHQVQHFTNTSSVKLSFDLSFSANGKGASVVEAVQEDRLFLKSLTHPWQSSTIDRGGPPRVLFLWPGLYSLTCVLRDLSFQYTQFNPALKPISFKASITLHEIRDFFVSMDDIRNGR